MECSQDAKAAVCGAIASDSIRREILHGGWDSCRALVPCTITLTMKPVYESFTIVGTQPYLETGNLSTRVFLSGILYVCPFFPKNSPKSGQLRRVFLIGNDISSRTRARLLRVGRPWRLSFRPRMNLVSEGGALDA